MNAFDPGKYSRKAPTPEIEDEDLAPPQQSSQEFDIGKYSRKTVAEAQENPFKSVFRTGIQIPLGIAEKFTFPLDLAEVAARGAQQEALREGEDMELARRYAPEELPGPVNQEIAQQEAERLFEYFPTQRKAEELIEEKTGIPLRPKGPIDTGVRLFSTGAAFAAPGKVSRSVAGLTTAGTYGGLKAAGVEDPYAEFFAILAGQGPGAAYRFVRNRLPAREAKELVQKLVGTPQGQTAFKAAEAAQKELTSIGRETLESEARTAHRAASEEIGKIETAEEAARQLGEVEAGERGAANTQEFQKARAAQKEQAARPQLGVAKIEVEPVEPVKPREIKPQSLGITPVPTKESDLQSKVGRVFSANKIDNSTKAAHTIENAVRDRSAKVYEESDKLYREVEELTGTVQDFYPGLVDFMLDDAKRLSKIAVRSPTENALLNFYKEFGGKLAVIDPETGNVVSYLEAPVSDLIAQARSAKKPVGYGFDQGAQKAEFKKVIGLIEDSASASLQRKNPQIGKKLEEAKRTYKFWSKRFGDNEKITPWLDKTNKNYIGRYNASKKLDDFVQLKPILENSPEGRLVLDSMERDIATEHLQKYINNPKSAHGENFERDLRELEPALGKEKVEKAGAELREAREDILRTERATKEAEHKVKGEAARVKEETRLAKEEAKAETAKRETAAKKEAAERRGRQEAHRKAEVAKREAEKKETVEKFKREVEHRAERRKEREAEAAKQAKERAAEKERITTETQRKIESIRKQAAKIAGTTPEQVLKDMGTVSGMRELKETLSKTETGKRAFNELQKQVANEMLEEGMIGRKFSGKQLEKVLTNHKNNDLFKEIFGAEVVDDAIKAAKAIGAKEFTVSALNQLLKFKGAIVLLKYINKVNASANPKSPTLEIPQ